MTLLQDTKRVLGTGTRQLGALVYWDNLTKVEILRTKMVEGFTAANLAAALATPGEPATILGLAVNRHAHQRNADAQIDMVAKVDAEVVYDVLGHDIDGDGHGAWTARVRLRLDRTLTRPVLDIAPIHGRVVTAAVDQVVQEVAQDYTALLDYARSTEISASLVRAMKVAGTLPLRSGVYLAPLSALPAIRALAKFIESESTIRFSVWDIFDGDNNAKTAKRDALGALTEKLNDLVTEVDAFTASVKPEEANFRNVAAFVRRFKELDGKVLVYADVLADSVGELQKAIDRARVTLTRTYIGDDVAA